MTGPELDGVSGAFFDGRRRAGPPAAARDASARRGLANLSERLLAGQPR